MSYFSNTLFPTVEAVFFEVRSVDLPQTSKEAADKIRAAGYPREAAYVESLSLDGLRSVYEYSGLVDSEKQAEESAWAMAEAEWSGS